MQIPRTASILFELGKTIIIVIIVLLLIHLFIATIFLVDGVSMEPNYHTGEVVLVNRLAYLTSTPRRGDVVVLRFPGDEKRSRYIKRIIGIPGDRVEVKRGKYYINGKVLIESYIPKDMITQTDNYRELTLGQNQYFLSGDNRPASNDSRIWGSARKEDLIGRTRLILWPIDKFGYIPDVYYKE